MKYFYFFAELLVNNLVTSCILLGYRLVYHTIGFFSLRPRCQNSMYILISSWNKINVNKFWCLHLLFFTLSIEGNNCRRNRFYNNRWHGKHTTYFRGIKPNFLILLLFENLSSPNKINGFANNTINRITMKCINDTI